MGIQHDYNSAKADPVDTTLVGATKWNADHYFKGGGVNEGALIYAGVSGLITNLNSVAAGSVLVSAGAGVTPEWSTTPSVTSYNATTHVAVGAVPATAGAVRLSNNEYLYSRNAANNGNVLLIGLDTADNVYVGSGSAATGLVLRNSAGTGITFETASVSRWSINSTGHLVAGTDGAYDIGGPGVTRPRNVYISNNLVVGAATAFGATAAHAQVRNYMSGSFTSTSTDVYGFYTDGALTPVSGSSAYGWSNVFTYNLPAAAPSVRGTNLPAPAITLATGAVTTAATLFVVGAPTISGGGTITNAYAVYVGGGRTRLDTLEAAAATGHAIGTSTSANIGISLRGAVTASAGVAVAAQIAGALTAAANGDALAGLNLGGVSFVKGAFTSLVASGLRLYGSNMTASGAGTIASAATVLIGDAPAIGTTNYSLWVVAGLAQFGGTVGLGTSVSLSGSGAGVLNQSFSTTPQVFRVFNTTDGGSNFEYANFGWSGSTLIIGTLAGGTGVKRTTAIRGNDIQFQFGASDTNAWLINSSGHLVATDNTYDIGNSLATRPRNLYVGTNGYFGGELFVNAQAAGNAFITLGASTANNVGRITLNISNTAHNWKIAVNDNVGGALAFHRSTAAGGTTYSTPMWYMDNAGHFMAGVDNSYDIGGSGVTRPRNLYVASSAYAANFIAVTAFSSAATTGTLITNSDIVLADDVTNSLGTSSSVTAIFLVVNITTGAAAIIAVGAGSVAMMSSPSGTWATADTDGFNCLYISAAVIYLKNRLGTSQTYKVTRVGQ